MIILSTALITKYTMFSRDISVYVTSGTKDPFVIKILILIILNSARIKKDQKCINKGDKIKSCNNNLFEVLIKRISFYNIIQSNGHQNINKNPENIRFN